MGFVDRSLTADYVCGPVASRGCCDNAMQEKARNAAGKARLYRQCADNSMGAISEPSPVLLLVAATSRHARAIEWARMRIEATFGPLAFASHAFDLTETDYYTATMGPDLKKQFFASERLTDPGRLAEFKRQTNQWEAEYAAQDRHAEPRPLNLDPGYITAAKLVLASTKDHAYGLYLRDSIYAELTLAFRRRAWQPLEWTCPGYERADYQEFFARCRLYLIERIAGS
jgi:hypothetical protein